jgi:hypothetical protein
LFSYEQLQQLILVGHEWMQKLILIGHESMQKLILIGHESMQQLILVGHDPEGSDSGGRPTLGVQDYGGCRSTPPTQG